MGIVYLASLIVGLGVLVLQLAMGGKSTDSVDADGDGAADDVGHDGKELSHGSDFVSLFLSTRFWIFAALAFGLSGTLIHWLQLAGVLATALIAGGAGVSSGLFASLAFRAVKRAATSTSAATTDAVGQVGRVLVGVTKGKVGQVRVQLKGSSVDLLATTDDDEIARGESVLVEDVRGEVAHVSRRPPELAE
jgi:membrane protein implicated in regulation of membrane protease activity